MGSNKQNKKKGLQEGCSDVREGFVFLWTVFKTPGRIFFFFSGIGLGLTRTTGSGLEGRGYVCERCVCVCGEREEAWVPIKPDVLFAA